MADTSLVVDLNDAKRTGKLLNKPSFFAVQLSSAVACNTLATVDGNTVFFFGVAFFFLVFGNSKTTDSYGLSGISNLYGLPSHSPFLAL